MAVAESILNLGHPFPLILPPSTGTSTITESDQSYFLRLYAGISWAGASESVEVGLSTVQNVRIIMTNAADTAALKAIPLMVTTLPVGNMQTSSRARVARTTSLATQVITGEMPRPETVNSIALVGLNLTSDATMQLECWSQTGQTGHKTVNTGTFMAIPAKTLGDLDWGIDPLGASLMDGWVYRYSLIWFASATVQSFQLTFTDPANPDGYMEFSRLMMGRYFSPQSNMLYGMRMGWYDDTKQYRTDGGSLRSDPQPSRRKWSFQLDALDPAERDDLLEHIRRVGKRDDLFLSCFPGAGGRKEINYAGHVRRAGSDEDVAPEFHFPGIHRVSLDFEEV